MSEEIMAHKAQKKGLGRGLGSLLGEANLNRVDEPISAPKSSAPIDATPASKIPDESRIWLVPIEKVIPNKEQPRKTFDQVRLQELAKSIREKGVLLPIIVRKLTSGEFEIIAGERRWRAAQQAGIHEVPVLIKPTEKQEALEIALIENIQRQDLNPMEESEAYVLLANKYGLTQQQIAEKVSKERSTIANLMRLDALASEVKSFVRNGEMQLGQAKVLLALERQQDQIALAKKILKQKMSVRAAEKLVAKFKAADGLEAKELALEKDSLREVQALKLELQKILGTKVDLEISGQRSKVSIHLYSLPELEQFIDKMRKLK